MEAINKEARIIKRRLRSSYLTAIISISLVLCMLGIVGLLLLSAHKMSAYIRENIGFSVYLKDNTKEADARMLQKKLDAAHYVSSTRYVSKEDAETEFTAELGEDFSAFLGYNPLHASIEVRMQSDYANNDSIAVIEKLWQSNPHIQEISYQKSLIDSLNENIENISIFFLSFSALLLIIAVTLINNTIRLSVYSQRTIIRTMQLVGAAPSFIRKPFLLKSVLHGIFGAIIALTILFSALYWMQSQLSSIISTQDYPLFLALIAIVIFLGISINVISTFFAVNKYLSQNYQRLHY